LVSAWTLESTDAGTVFTVDLSMVGEIDADLAATVTGRSVLSQHTDDRSAD
jgi:hypothetical protein